MNNKAQRSKTFCIINVKYKQNKIYTVFFNNFNIMVEVFDSKFYEYLSSVLAEKVSDCDHHSVNKERIVMIEDLIINKNNYKIYLQNVFLQGIHKYKNEKYNKALSLFPTYGILMEHRGFSCIGVCPPQKMKKYFTESIPDGMLQKMILEGLKLLDEGENTLLHAQIISNPAV